MLTGHEDALGAGDDLTSAKCGRNAKRCLGDGGGGTRAVPTARSARGVSRAPARCGWHGVV